VHSVFLQPGDPGRVAEGPEAVCPLLPGARIPDLSVQDPEGRTVDLAALVAGKPTVLVFFRGG
jgi:cytochrome oxidase Cu insertion factor (SCO1/SenC/PrrC family)